MTSNRFQFSHRKNNTLRGTILGCGLVFMLAGCGVSKVPQQTVSTDAVPVINPENWPELPALPVDQAVEKRVDELISTMSLRDKVAQLIQADLSQITPQEMRQYRLGSLLQGGNTGPNGQQYGTVKEWVATLDEYWLAAMSEREDGGVLIPPVIGIDAVHGHNNVIGGTIFPHNIGLGAMNNPALIRRIAEVTATELVVTGHDWTFAPTLAVVRDDRWGRAYEGYSEHPDIVARYAREVVLGLQGTPGEDSYFANNKVISTAKHFVGDGGTTGGRDTGDNQMTEQQLRDNQAAGYVPALEAGVSSIMASFSSWHGQRMHGHEPLLTDVLKERWNFNGFVVGDWNGHGLVAGCSDTSCSKAVNSGLDMFMAPDSWRLLYASTLAQAESGAISLERLDDAVRRILRIKFTAGLMDKPRPSQRPLVGDETLLGAAEHRQIARQAVRESLVLLKNNGVLPLSPGAKLLVAGDAANSIGKVSGGWTLTWQGGDFDNSLFPNGQSIFAAIEQQVLAAGGSATYSADGVYDSKPDAAIVIFGEEPYAEFIGDVEHVGYDVKAEREIQLLRRLKAAGIPVVSVFISGRPMWVNPELNASDAFVAAWLPGSEGGGVADLLLADSRGKPRYDFTGKLSFSWPATAGDTGINVGDEPYAPLFPYGYGLSYTAMGSVAQLSEEPGIDSNAGYDALTFYAKGQPGNPWSLYTISEAQWQRVGRESRQQFAGVSLARIDHHAQEDAWQLLWDGSENAAVVLADTTTSHGYQRQESSQMALAIDYRLNQPIDAELIVGLGCADINAACFAQLPLSAYLNNAKPGIWRTLRIPLSCFTKEGANMRKINIPVSFSSSGKADFSFSRVQLEPGSDGELKCEGGQ